MNMQATQTRLRESLKKKKKGPEVRRGKGRIEVDVIKLRCMCAWNFQKIKILK